VLPRAIVGYGSIALFINRQNIQAGKVRSHG
jgi:hypothetical protein